MKLNYKRTVFVGFAFFLICAFWQAYDTIIPKILTDKFGMSQTFSGLIMALDNIFALFLLPLFGSLSDKFSSKKGKRTPFIIIGTILASVFFFSLSFADGMQLTRISDVSDINSKKSLEVLYDYSYDTILKTPDGEEFTVTSFDRDDFIGITTETVWYKNNDGTISTSQNATSDGKSINPYVDYVSPARRAYAWDTVRSAPNVLIFFVGLLLAALLSMALFRSPAVALMPDVTIKPLRSKANAVINLMGAAGGILVLGLGGVVFKTGNVENSLMSYTLFFGAIAIVMVVCLIVFLLTVNEPKLSREMIEESRRLGIDTKDDEPDGKNKKDTLSKGEMRSLILILLSVVLWYFAYNAVTSKYSVYAGAVLQKDYNLTLIIAQAAAIVSYIPIGIISSKLGRKRTILAGVVMLTAAFATASFITASSPVLLMNAMFVLAGLGWAAINVNSFPMVVELSNNNNIGKYTGFYYTASMAAQTATPLLSGFLMDNLGMKIMFPYAAVFSGLAFVTMMLVRHGDSKAE